MSHKYLVLAKIEEPAEEEPAEQVSGGLGGAALFDFEDAASQRVAENAEITVTACQTFLIQTQMRHGCGCASRQSAPHRTVHQSMDLTGTETQQASGLRLHFGRLQNADGKVGESVCEARVRLAPRHGHGLHSMFGAVHPGHARHQKSQETATVQVTPATLFALIVARAAALALGTQ